MEHQVIPANAASEVLFGEDFAHINEAAPRLVRELASRAGKSVIDLRKMAAEGNLTSAVLLGQQG